MDELVQLLLPLLATSIVCALEPDDDLLNLCYVSNNVTAEKRRSKRTCKTSLLSPFFCRFSINFRAGFHLPSEINSSK